MDNFFQKCIGCRKKRFYVKHRKYIVNGIPVTSNDKLCGQCYRNLTKLVLK